MTAGRLTVGLAVVLLATAGFARAQAVDPIAVRQAGYALMGAAAGDMKRGVDAGVDPKLFADGADAMVLWGTVIPTLFPPGTESGHGTRAKPEVWSDRAGFEKAAANFVATVQQLAIAAKANDKAAFAEAFKATDQACVACHRSYRARQG